MRLRRGGRKEKPSAEPDVIAARESLSDSTSRRSWLASLVLGAFATLLVFVFLGYLQPTMSSSEAISLPDIVQLQTGLGTHRKPPPPPKQQAQQKPKRKSTPKQAKRAPRRTIAKTRAPRTQQNTRQLNALAAMASGLDIGLGAGSGVQMPLALTMDSGDYEKELREVEEYQEIRRAARQRSYDRSRGGGMGSFGGYTEPRLIYRPDPQYPHKARQDQIEGFVIIKVLISADGSISEFEILGALPEGVFVDAVIDSLSRWRFSPAQDADGRPIEVWKDYRIEFELEAK